MNSERLKQTEKDVENCRAKVNGQHGPGVYGTESYGFVSLSTLPLAQEVTQNLENELPAGIKVILATDPKDVVSISITIFIQVVISVCTDMGKLEYVLRRAGLEEDHRLAPSHHRPHH